MAERLEPGEFGASGILRCIPRHADAIAIVILPPQLPSDISGGTGGRGEGHCAEFTQSRREIVRSFLLRD